MKLNALITMAAIAALACLPAAADVIYDNGASDDSWVWRASGDMEIFDNFELTADAILADVHWTGGAYYGYTPASETFAISIFEDNAGAPGTLVHQYTGVSATREVETVWPGGDVIYNYSADVAPLSLSGGTAYWISIYHENLDTNFGWYWSTSNGTAGNAMTLYDGWWWDPAESEFAFYLTSSDAIVPEPATMSLLGLGIAALGLRRARRRKHSG